MPSLTLVVNGRSVAEEVWKEVTERLNMTNECWKKGLVLHEQVGRMYKGSDDVSDCFVRVEASAETPFQKLLIIANALLAVVDVELVHPQFGFYLFHESVGEHFTPLEFDEMAAKIAGAIPKPEVTRETLEEARQYGAAKLAGGEFPLDLMIADIPGMVEAAMRRGLKSICVYCKDEPLGSISGPLNAQKLLDWCKGWCVQMGDEFQATELGSMSTNSPIVISWRK